MLRRAPLEEQLRVRTTASARTVSAGSRTVTPIAACLHPTPSFTSPALLRFPTPANSQTLRMSPRCAHPQLPTASRDHIRRGSWQVRMAALQSFAAQRQRPSSRHGGRPARAGCGKQAPRRQGCSTARTRQRTRHRTTPGMKPRLPVRTEHGAFQAAARRQLHPRVVPVRTGSSRSRGERSPFPTAFEAPRQTSRVRTKGTAARM